MASVVRVSEIVKVDSKGRITIPQTMREALGIEPGMIMAIIADFEKREIIVSPITGKGEMIYELDLYLVDKPGSLASVTEVLARHKADIVASKCVSIARGEEAGCTIIVDMSIADTDMETIRRELEDLGVVIQVRVKKFESRF
ncbi:MAG: AbrB family DNA-binding protein [Thermoprotei archaeon]|nr:AbrB family DNA-binding protein [Thermoprotei archaeon]